MRARLLIGAGLILAVMIVSPTVATIIAQSPADVSSNAADSPETVTAAAAQQLSACDISKNHVAEAQQLIVSRWTEAAARAQQLGATSTDVNAAKKILLSSDPPEERQAHLVSLYQTSSLKNLGVTDLDKVYAVVEARTQYEDALRDQATACPASVTSDAPKMATDPMKGADAVPNQLPPASTSKGQVMVVPNGAPQTGDGTLAS